MNQVAKNYRKKPVVIQAVQYNGDINDLPIEFFHSIQRYEPNSKSAFIHTLEGDMECKVGDFIICGVKCEFYPCKPDVFAATYEEVI